MHPWLHLACLAFVIASAGCADRAESPAPAPPPSVTGELPPGSVSASSGGGATGGVPSSTPTQFDGDGDVGGPPGVDALGQFAERCSRATAELDEAEVRFDDEVELRTGDEDRFTVTLGAPGLPRDTESADPVQGRVALACEVAARLVVNGSRVSVEPTGWSDDTYVPPDPTTWTWVVAAKEPGVAQGSVELRPAVRVTDDSGEVQVEDLRTVEYPLTFTVTRSGGDTAAAAWRWVVGAVGLLAVVLTALETARRLRTRRGKEEGAGADEEGEAVGEEGEEVGEARGGEEQRGPGGPQN